MHALLVPCYGGLSSSCGCSLKVAQCRTVCDKRRSVGDACLFLASQKFSSIIVFNLMWAATGSQLREQDDVGEAEERLCLRYDFK